MVSPPTESDEMGVFALPVHLVGMALRAVYIPPFAKARRMGTREFVVGYELLGGPPAIRRVDFMSGTYSGDSHYSSAQRTEGLTVYSGKVIVTSQTLTCSPYLLWNETRFLAPSTYPEEQQVP